jgi:hypothetical protein
MLPTCIRERCSYLEAKMRIALAQYGDWIFSRLIKPLKEAKIISM